MGDRYLAEVGGRHMAGRAVPQTAAWYDHHLAGMQRHLLPLIACGGLHLQERAALITPRLHQPLLPPLLAGLPGDNRQQQGVQSFRQQETQQGQMRMHSCLGTSGAHAWSWAAHLDAVGG